MKLEGNYVPLAEAARSLGVTAVRLRQLCQQNRIVGAMKMSETWFIPKPFKILMEKKDKNRQKKLRMKAS
jgi:hypothetical protein